MRWMLLAAALVGCGGSASPEEKLQGKWLGATSAACANAISFVGAVFETDFICTLSNGGTGLTAEVGTFKVDRGTMFATVTQVTCPERAGSWVSAFTVDGDSLTLVTPNGVFAFSRIHEMPSTTGGTAIFGCFDQAGAFTQSPLRAVR